MKKQESSEDNFKSCLKGEGFILRKWKSSIGATLHDVKIDLRDNMNKEITEDERFTMV